MFLNVALNNDAKIMNDIFSMGMLKKMHLPERFGKETLSIPLFYRRSKNHP